MLQGKAKWGDSEHHAADNLDEQLAAVGLGVKETVGGALPSLGGRV